jgi:hypothetical protein
MVAPAHRDATAAASGAQHHQHVVALRPRQHMKQTGVPG